MNPTDSYLHANDTIPIQYNPNHPEKSFYAEAHSATNRRLLFFGVGAVIAVVVLVIVFLNGRFK